MDGAFKQSCLFCGKISFFDSSVVLVNLITQIQLTYKALTTEVEVPVSARFKKRTSYQSAAEAKPEQQTLYLR